LWLLRYSAPANHTLSEQFLAGSNVNKTATTEKRRDLAYILAPSYTGSTLLTFLLSMNEGVATIGELKATARGDLDTYLCSCGLVQRECPFWKKVSAEMQKIDADFGLEDFGTHFRGDSFLCDRLLRAGVRARHFETVRDSLVRFVPSWRARLAKILDRNRQIIDVICNLQQGSMFLDGSKDPIRLRLLNSAEFWSIKVIYLIRDGRGATNSYMRHYNVPMETAAREWCTVHQECDRVVRELSDGTCTRIHYEDLCRDPEKTMATICDFLGLRVGSVDFESGSSEHHILGNQMRLKSTKEIRLDEKWKDALAQEDLSVFGQIAGRFNRRYGYE
jgi:hypothetical protein